MKRILVGVGVGSVMMFVAEISAASPRVGHSLDECQRTVQRESVAYGTAVFRALASCMQKVSGEVVRRDQSVPDASKAVNGCIADLLALQRGNSDLGRAADKILRACDPAHGGHGADDVLGTGTLSGNQSLEAELRLDDFCGAFGEGAASVGAWVECTLAAAECQARQQVAVAFPRAVEWLELLGEALVARTDPRSVEAHALLLVTLAAIDGTPAGDGLADIACGAAAADESCSIALGQAEADLAACAADLEQAQDTSVLCLESLDTCSTDLAVCTDALDACLSDPGPPQTCGNALLDEGEECDQGNLGGATCVSQGFAGGSLGCGAGCVLDTSDCWSERYVDNGDGSLLDNATGLVWEKKVALGGGTDYANLQDADNTYRWAGTCSGATLKRCQPDEDASAACLAGVQGDASACELCVGAEGVCNVSTPGITVWQWLAGLNGAAYAGHGDWRLPRRSELETLLQLDFDTASAPLVAAALHGASCAAACVDVSDPACACTRSDSYWTGSSYQVTPTFSWVVNFMTGAVSPTSKTLASGARAVRGGE